MKVGRLWENIRSRFGFGSKLVVSDEPQERPDRRRLPRVKRTGFLNMEAFAGELVQIKEGASDAPLPHLHVFSLSDFRNAVGKKWDKLGGLVEVAVESIIRRHVNTDKDIFTRLDAEIACLALPQTTRAETRTRVTAIAKDIAAHLFGDAVIDGRRPQVLAANLPLEEALTDEGEMDWEAIHSALAKAGAALEASVAAMPKGQAAPHRSTLAELMTPEDAAMAKAEAEAMAKAKKTGFAISGGDERRQVSAPAWFVEQMEGQGNALGEGGRKGADAPMRVMTLSQDGGGADSPQRVMVMPQGGLGGADAARTVMDMSGNALHGADAARTVMQVSGTSLHGADAARTVMDMSGGGRGGSDTRIQAGSDLHPPAAVQASWYQEDGKGHLSGADAERRVMVVDGGPKGPSEMDVMQVEGAGNWAGGTGLSPETSLTLVWTPTWVTSRRAIGAFHARIIRSDKDGAPTLEGVHAYNGATPVEALTLDRFAASQAAKELTGLFYARQKLGLTIPIHWMSLSPKHRDMVRIPFEACPTDARRKFLKVEVFGLNASIPSQVLRRMFEPLERVGCDVMARLPLSAVDMIPALAHLRAVGVDLAELPEDDRVGDDELFRRLEAFREVAKKVKVASYVWGVRRRPLIAKLVASGFSLVNGPGVMCDLSHPTLPSKGGQAV